MPSLSRLVCQDGDLSPILIGDNLIGWHSEAFIKLAHAIEEQLLIIGNPCHFIDESLLDLLTGKGQDPQIKPSTAPDASFASFSLALDLVENLQLDLQEIKEWEQNHPRAWLEQATPCEPGSD